MVKNWVMTTRIGQHKQPLGTRKSSTNCCHRWRRDSTAQTPPRDSDIINEMLSRLTQGFDSPNTPSGLRYHQRSVVKDDAGIRQPKHPLGTKISSTQCCHGWCKDSAAQTAHRVSEIIKETPVTGGLGIGQPKQPLGTRKSSTNCCHGWRRDSTAQTAPRDSDIINELVSRVTHGLDSTNSP